MEIMTMGKPISIDSVNAIVHWGQQHWSKDEDVLWLNPTVFSRILIPLSHAQESHPLWKTIFDVFSRIFASTFKQEGGRINKVMALLHYGSHFV